MSASTALRALLAGVAATALAVACDARGGAERTGPAPSTAPVSRPAETPRSSAPPASSPATPRAGAAPGPELVYTETRDEGASVGLWVQPVPSGARRRVLLVERGQAAGLLLRPDADQPYIVSDTRHDVGGDDFFAAPEIRLYEPTDGALGAHDDLGPGHDLSLSADGTRLAWTAPTATRTCSIEQKGCTEPPVRVHVASADDPARRQTSGPFDDVRGVSWAGAGKLLLHGRHETAVLDIETGVRTAVAVPGTVLAVDPVHERMLVAGDGLHELTLRTLDGDEVWRKSFGDRRVAVSIAPDGRTALIELVRVGPDATSTARLAILDMATGSVRELSERRSDGNLLWSVSGRSYGYRRTTGDGMSFEFMTCAAAGDRCRVAMRWEEGRTVLGFRD